MYECVVDRRCVCVCVCVCLCVCVCVFECLACVVTFTHVYANEEYENKSVRECVYMFVCVHVCVCVCYNLPPRPPCPNIGSASWGNI